MINGLNTDYYNLTGLREINVDNINASGNIDTGTLENVDGAYFQNITSNVQSQINTLQSNIDSVNTSIINVQNGTGGYFTVWGELQVTTWSTTQTFFQFGGGNSLNVGVYLPDCQLVRMGVNCSKTATSNTDFQLTTAAGGTVYATLTLPSGSQFYNTTFNGPSFNAGSRINLRTGGNGTFSSNPVSIRFTAIFATNGAIFDSPYIYNYITSLSGTIASYYASSNTSTINNYYNYSTLSSQIVYVSNNITNNYNTQNSINNYFSSYLSSLSGYIINVTNTINNNQTYNNNINNYYSIYLTGLSGAFLSYYNNTNNTITNNINNQNAINNYYYSWLNSLSGQLLSTTDTINNNSYYQSTINNYLLNSISGIVYNVQSSITNQDSINSYFYRSITSLSGYFYYNHLTWRGEFDTTGNTTYYYGDCVYTNELNVGSSYVCIVDVVPAFVYDPYFGDSRSNQLLYWIAYNSPLNVQNPKWHLLAMKGDTGDTGSKGDKGDTGATGATGAAGASGSAATGAAFGVTGLALAGAYLWLASLQTEVVSLASGLTALNFQVFAIAGEVNSLLVKCALLNGNIFTGQLDVAGGLIVAGESVLSGATIINGSTTMNGVCNINGACNILSRLSCGLGATFNSSVYLNGGVHVYGDYFQWGNCDVLGKLEVSGEGKVSSKLTCGSIYNRGDCLNLGNLTVAKYSTFYSDITIADGRGLYNKKKLINEDEATFKSTVLIQGKTLIQNQAIIEGVTQIKSFLFVGDNYSNNNKKVVLQTYGAERVVGNLYVTGDLFLSGNLFVKGNIFYGGELLKIDMANVPAFQ